MSPSPPPPSYKGAASDWAALPIELLAPVADRLRHSVYYVRFRSVCTRWRAAAPRIRFPPLLALPFDSDAAALPFLDPSENSAAGAAVIRYLPLPEARHQALLGSSRGWLFLIDEAGSVSLLNPFTRARFPLPPVTASLARASGLSVAKVSDRWVLDCRDGQQPVTLYHMRTTFIREATISSSPSSGDACALVVAVLASSTKLAFCRIGDCEWTLFDTALHNAVCSVAHCDGRFYAVDAFGEVCVCDIGPLTMRATYISSLLLPPERDRFRLMGFKKELLLVAHYTHWFKHRYEIYRADIKPGMKWSRVGSIGDRTLFLSAYFNSNAIGGAFHGCKSNAIYFSEPICDDREPSRSQIHRMALMDVTNGCMEAIASNCNGQFSREVFWLTPCLC